tara:strand:+ start:535 stop:741 length:207 start_codon:yes stop_codon:yes gene_type:complete
VKNLYSAIKYKTTLKNTFNGKISDKSKSADINVLLNRVKSDQKKENRKKIIFTAATSLGVVMFGILVF